jgi:DUF971 family protein
VTPLSIEADRAAGTITIEWDDGHRSCYTSSQVRWACPCAECRGEWGRPGRLASLSTLPADEMILTDVQPVGTYAIMPVWGSGHQTGLFSFDYLRQMCTCDVCSRTPQGK